MKAPENSTALFLICLGVFCSYLNIGLGANSPEIPTALISSGTTMLIRRYQERDGND
jgi:hypothetical protein